MARRQSRSPGVAISPVRWVLVIAAVALTAQIVVLWLTGGAVGDAYRIGEVIGAHLAAALITALIASFTRLGSFGAMVAVYVLGFGAIEILLAFTA